MNKALGDAPAIEAWSASHDVGLRVAFVRLADRFQHVVSVLKSSPLPSTSPLPEGEGTVLLRSLEGTGSDAWPSSPPLQSLHIETLPDGRKAALLVGMAGRGHWSASIEAVAGAAAVVFDIACRSSTPPRWLGSTYMRDAATARLQLIPEAAGVNQPPRVISGETVVIECPLGDSRGPTWRWRYRLELLPLADEFAS